MVAVNVNRVFYDRQAKVTRRVGDTFDATEERAEELSAALPGYVTVSKPKRVPRKRTPKE